jgi:serine/threonine protein kinase
LQVLLKVLHKSSKDAIRMFQQEAALLQRLHHEQIPDLRAYFEEEDRFFIVMDLVSGDDLCKVVGDSLVCDSL